MHLRPSHNLNHNERTQSIELAKQKTMLKENERRLHWFEHQNELDIIDFEEYLHYIKTGKEGFEPILEIEQTDPPFNNAY